MGGGGGGGEESGDAAERNKREAIMALAEAGRSFDSIPEDLAAALEAGRIPGSIVSRYFELEKSLLLRWLLNFGGFKERLLADDLFLTKVAIECGVGIFTKVLHLFHLISNSAYTLIFTSVLWILQIHLVCNPVLLPIFLVEN